MLETGVFEVVLPELAAHYGVEGVERDALLALLGAIDARVAGGLDVSAGEIFAALLFAPLAPRLGWPLAAGGPAAKGHADARTVVDDVLRPIALRLRVARKDQERARQRSPPSSAWCRLRPMRRGFRGAIQRRPAFADAWWMLEALAPVLGGDFDAARAGWAEQLARPTSEPLAAVDEAAEDEPAEAGDAPRPRRRRGRRGGRGRREPHPRALHLHPSPRPQPPPLRRKSSPRCGATITSSPRSLRSRSSPPRTWTPTVTAPRASSPPR
jgi:hypothetical protein